MVVCMRLCLGISCGLLVIVVYGCNLGNTAVIEMGKTIDGLAVTVSSISAAISCVELLEVD